MHGYITGSRAAMNVADYAATKPEMVSMEFAVKVTVDPERYADEFGDELDTVRQIIADNLKYTVAAMVCARGTGLHDSWKHYMRTELTES
jgi:hypothetical protein